jgi:hypothetical protein
LKPDKYGYLSKYPLRRFAEKFFPDEIELGKRQSYYSLRHNFRDALRRASASRDALQALGGWSQGDAAIRLTRDSGLYGSGCSLHVALDNREVAFLDPGKTTVVRTSPGLHEIKASASDWCGGPLQYYTANAKAGVETRISFGRNDAQAVIIRHDEDRVMQKPGG